MRWFFVLILLAGCARPEQTLWLAGPATVTVAGETLQVGELSRLDQRDLTRGIEVNGERSPDIPPGHDLVCAPGSPDLRLVDYSSMYQEVPDAVLSVDPLPLPPAVFWQIPRGAWVLAPGTRLPKVVSGPGCYRFERVPPGLSEDEVRAWLKERIQSELGKPAQRVN